MIHDENDGFDYEEAEEISFSDYVKDIKNKLPYGVKLAVAGDMACRLDKIKSICYGRLNMEEYDRLLEQIKSISDFIDKL